MTKYSNFDDMGRAFNERRVDTETRQTYEGSFIEASEMAKQDITDTEEERHRHLFMIGNTLHPSVPISNDEVGIN